MDAMDTSAVKRWVAEYERLWRTAGTDGLSGIFTADISYVPSPWAEPIQGLEALAGFWEAERKGPDEEFVLSSDLVAVEGATAVIRVSVDYGAPGFSRWRDLWVTQFADDGRCSSFEEWPFSPSQPDGH